MIVENSRFSVGFLALRVWGPCLPCCDGVAHDAFASSFFVNRRRGVAALARDFSLPASAEAHWESSSRSPVRASSRFASPSPFARVASHRTHHLAPFTPSHNAVLPPPPPPPSPTLPRIARYIPDEAKPRFVLCLPNNDPSKLPREVIGFCFPDIDHLLRAPYAYEHTADEYAFTLTQKSDPQRLHGFCRRFRVGSAAVGHRLDLPAPASGADDADAAAAPSYQCICILSERPLHRFFSQCLQLLHAARLAGGPTAVRLAMTLLSYNNAPPSSVIPLRSLLNAPGVPGSLRFSKERLRVPAAVGLPYLDVPLAPLLSRLPAPALLALYVALLCERRIVLVSQNMATLTSCAHATLAIIAPFEWQNIFIPVITSALLGYAGAPNPFIIGMTPAQFLELNELHEPGEILLVALDEGYVACLTGAPPLVDLDGALPSNGNSGTVSYAGPRLTPERVAARFATEGVTDALVDADGNRGGGGYGEVAGPVTSSGGHFAANQATMTLGRRNALAQTLASHGAAIARGQVGSPIGLGGGGGSRMPSSSATLEAALSPFHAFSRAFFCRLCTFP